MAIMQLPTYKDPSEPTKTFRKKYSQLKWSVFQYSDPMLTLPKCRLVRLRYFSSSVWNNLFLLMIQRTEGWTFWYDVSLNPPYCFDKLLNKYFCISNWVLSVLLQDKLAYQHPMYMQPPLIQHVINKITHGVTDNAFVFHNLYVLK